MCALALSIAYGALTSEFAAALVCTVASPMSVRDYLQTANDGSTLLAQRRSLAPSALPALLAVLRAYRELGHSAIEALRAAAHEARSEARRAAASAAEAEEAHSALVAAAESKARGAPSRAAMAKLNATLRPT